MKFTKTGRYLLNLVCFILPLIIVFTVLGRALVPVSYALYYHHDLETMREKGETYDLIFIGASRTYRSFDPEIFAENTDYKNVLNAGSVAQTVEGSYYLAKELIKTQHPKTIVLGVTYNLLFEDQEDEGPRGNMVLYDRLEDPLNRIQFALDVLRGNDLLYLSNIYRYGSSISLSYLKEVYEEKKALEESDYAPVVKKKEYYAGNGFVYSYRSAGKGTIPIKHEDVFELSKIDQNKKKYLDGIVKLCKDNGVTLHLVTGPTTMMYMYAVQNYQDAVDYYVEYAKENGLSYHNLSYLKDRETLFSEDYMLDYNHANGEGAANASRLYAEIMTKYENGEDTSDYFYSGLEEIQSHVDYVVAIKADSSLDLNTEKGRRLMTVHALANEGEEVEFQIRVKNPGDEHYRIVYDYTTDTVFDMTDLIKANGKVAVYAKLKGHEKKEAAQIYTVSKNCKSLSWNRR